LPLPDSTDWLMTTSVKLLHTSDWHLGHELFNHSREAEHEAFLAWLLDALEEHDVDVLLVTGDIYDVANPPVSAQQQLYRFVARARARMERLQIVMIGGNHDSALRIDLPGALVDERVRFLGALPRRMGENGREPDCERICIPLSNDEGEVAAWLAAVPYCRPGDLGCGGLAELYACVSEAAAAKAGPLPLVLTGHLHVAGGAVSELSERRIVIGGEEAEATSLFDARAAYVALGHLHRPQTIGAAVPIRYAGSPFPLSASERTYRHSVTLVTLDPAGAEIEEVPIPRPVAFQRVPEAGPAPLAEVLAELGRLEEDAGADQAFWPFVKIDVLVDRPEPDLNARILSALEGRKLRLAGIQRHSPMAVATGATGPREQELGSLKPDGIFAELHRQCFGTAPDTALERGFAELLLAAHSMDADGEPEQEVA